MTAVGNRGSEFYWQYIVVGVVAVVVVVVVTGVAVVAKLPGRPWDPVLPRASIRIP